MKFLFVGTNPEHTGAATHFVALAQAMAESGHEVSAVVYPDGLIWRGLSGSPVRLYPAKFRNILDMRGYYATFKAAHDLKPDWLVGNFGKEYWPLILISRLLRVPVALFRHRTPNMSLLSGYWLPRLAQRFFAVSNYARQAYIDRGIPGPLVRVLYNPINMSLFRPDSHQRSEIFRELGLDENSIVLGFVGRIHGGKGIWPLFEAASAAMLKEPRLHCLWIGEGPDAVKLRQHAASHPTARQHHFLGWIQDVHPYYSAMSMLAFPSIAPETFGRVSVEAQAAGLPVLGSNVGGIPETLLPSVTGVLLPPVDVAAWEQAILKMCDPTYRLPMSAAAHDYVQQHFSTSVIATEFVKILTTT